ncbi:uncharacterized protein LOC116207929 isoform X2 [Punica granatum]|uniref:Uncharacterized protein LOC116207929 isoform X2 n=1 Tax=Punica granatum TaxID=22663 RepID=A0A6P8DX85_PUNGR|nr:uncharacterized protein LOC116207929 isoform X2 [Punica granatum]
MDENSDVIAQILKEQEEEERQIKQSSNRNDNKENSGWQTVSYPKRHKKQLKSQQQEISSSASSPNGAAFNGPHIFQSIELQYEDRIRRAREAQAAAASAAAVTDLAGRSRSKRHSDDDDDEDDNDSDATAAVENGGGQVKKVKPKKPKKPKVTVAEAAAKIDAADLSAFLADITVSYESQQDIQLMRFADYFGRAFASVGAAQFPWLKIFKESPVAKLVDDVYKASVDWLNQRSLEALGSFVLWSMDTIVADLTSHLGTASKVSKKVVQPVSSKSQVGIFVALAMVLRRKPDALVSVISQLKENPRYQGQDKLPITVWVISQASQGDLSVGLYMWARLLLPLVNGKSCNPQSRDLILQLVERILSSPKARPILLNGAVRKGERLVPPSAFEILMRVTFPAPSARLKATERFEAVYPTLREVALAGTSGSKALKQVAVQMSNFAIKAAGEGISDLCNEASSVFIWCLTQNSECYKLWDKLYMDNLEASVVILKQLSEEWKVHSVKHYTLDPVRETLKAFRQKNETALPKEEDTARRALLKDADKYCKVILGKISKGHGCMKFAVLASILAIGAAIASQNMEDWDLKKLSELFNIPQNF